MSTCSECTFLNPDSCYKSYDCKYWCEARLEYHYANEQDCYRFTRAYSRSDSVADSLRRKSEESQRSSGCFITTMVVDILKQNDKSDDMMKLREFRNNILIQNEKYKKALVEYDVVGPEIAVKLITDSNKVQISKNLYNMVICNVIKLYEKKRYDEAVALYADMTSLLVSGYGITKSVTKEEVDDALITSCGHGKYVKKWNV